MFGNLKKKLSHAIQEGITISENIRQAVTSPINSNPSSPSSMASSAISLSAFSDVDIPPHVNMAAGSNLLAKYQQDWQAIHEANESNAQLADVVAQRIENIQQVGSKQRVDLADLSSCFVGIPQLVAKLKDSQEVLKELGGLCITVEKELNKLQDLCEECELQEEFLHKQCEMNLHQQNKMVALECYRQKVAAEHQAIIREHEQRLRQIQRERQAVFDEAFRSDIDEYKRKGSIPKMQKQTSKSLSLEEVELDATPKDALEEFLNA